MAKRARTNGSKTTARRLAEGRGQGRGSEYVPWLKIHDVPSQGQANRVTSPLHSRTCHLMSKLETDWFYAFHELPGIGDIREQFPLGHEETIEIANQLGIKHPTDPRSKETCVVSTDFLLTLKDEFGFVERAIAVKTSSDLASKRTLEKLEIERVYWSARNIDWFIVTEKELPRALVKNQRWLQPFIDLPASGDISEDQIARIRCAMEPEIFLADKPLVEITNATDDQLGLNPGMSLCVVRHLLASKVWPVNLSVEIHPQLPLVLNTEEICHADTSKFAA